jgi:hypothetical protein
MDRSSLNSFGRVPMARATQTIAPVGDDHTRPLDRHGTGNGFGRVPMARVAAAAGVVTPTPGNAEEMAKQAWLAKQDVPSWGNK